MNSLELTPDTGSQVKPPYCPYATFKNFIGRLKADGVPQRVDRTAVDSLSGAAQSQLLGALTFLGLIDGSGSPQPVLARLTENHGTPEWSDKLGVLLQHAYSGILGDIDISSAVMSQLTEAFRSRGGDGSSVDKGIRFYLKALDDADVAYSPHLGKRRQSSSRTRKAKKNARVSRQKPARNPPQNAGDDTSKNDMIEFPIHLHGREGAKLVLPRDIRPEELALIEATVQYVKLYADQQN